MRKIFGTKENVLYTARKGAYLIPIKDGRVGVIKTPKGYFLLGGGIDKNESCEDCIKRECIEEAGLKVRISDKICSAESYTLHPVIGYFHPVQEYFSGEIIGSIQAPAEADHEFMWMEYESIKGKMFAEMQGWAIDQAMIYYKK